MRISECGNPKDHRVEPALQQPKSHEGGPRCWEMKQTPNNLGKLTDKFYA
jgi:hypothetical protein